MNQLDALSSLAIGGDQEAVCYLCLDGGGVEAGQPLRRDCACRGSDAGFVHLSCFAEYAAAKSKQAHGMNLDMNEFSKPWRVCPGCHQEYQNELAVDIATEFVSFVRRQYPRDTERQLVSLYLKLNAFDSMFDRLQPRQMREFGVTADVLLSLIDRMKGDTLSLPIRYSQMEAKAHNVHGCIALKEGTDESARRAVVHFVNELEASKVVGNAGNVAAAKSNIANAKALYEGGNIEELLKNSKELYDLRVAKYGEEDEYTIIAGKNHALRLQKVDRGDEARELLTKLLATSKRVLGPNHNATKKVESELKQVVEVKNNNSI